MLFEIFVAMLAAKCNVQDITAITQQEQKCVQYYIQCTNQIIEPMVTENPNTQITSEDLQKMLDSCDRN